MYQYQKDGSFAQAPGMMEELCEQELIELGAANTKVAYRGVYFEADKTALYRINYTSRLLSRVLAPLITFHCHNTNALIKTAEKSVGKKYFLLIKLLQ
ncbi:MAG: THUMP domain-containing protein [Ignavibacteriales bacterium]|nr:THUMP domain-containing protein [Ignavibacteriales bacterium]